MVPCLSKKMFGIDCMGCGIQRSINLLLQGEFIAAFKMYPAIYTLIILFGFILLNIKFKFQNAQKIISILAVLNVLIIITSYILKMNQLI
ncbi:DUF2752 domain-containing protein [Tenacibaculum sp. 190130A14a]